MERFTVGVDIGGTFTDIVFVDDSGQTDRAKTLTTHGDLTIGVCRGIQDALDYSEKSLENASIVIHGTTLVVNTLIERKGAKTALLTTRGFRDQIEIGTQIRYDPYDLFLERARPLVPRELRIPVTERILADGTIYEPLDEQEVQRIVKDLRSLDVEAIAVSLLHSYRYPIHERRVRDIIQGVAPEIVISLSSEIVPEIREYPRTTTTCANVFVQPLVSNYLGKLEESLRKMGFSGHMLMMLSSGGLSSVATAARFPVRLLESGPVGGALTASFYSERCTFENLLVFDMGGTTAKVSLVDDGKPMTTNEIEVARAHRLKRGSGIPIRIPCIEMIEVGAGGGSIARVDRMGLLKVGPESAGSEPGPACYGQGGLEPTVTDADLVLGYLDPDHFLGGEMKLDREAARDAIDRVVARPLEIDVVEAAWGIHRIVNENMAAAARVHAIERGKDIRAYPVFAFGGAGPVHAGGVAKILGVSRVISPVGAGVASAFGFLTAPLAFEFVQSEYGRLEDQDWTHVNSTFRRMEEEGTSLLVQAGLRKSDIAVERSADIRYVGQNYEILVDVPPGELNWQSGATIEDSLDRRYRELYAGISETLAAEILTWRVLLSGPKPPLRIAAGRVDPYVPSQKRNRLMYLAEDGDFYLAPVYERENLTPGAEMTGPAVVEARESTMIITRGSVARVDAYGNLLTTISHGKA